MPWITATTTTRNPTDTMIPSSVKNERSLWLHAVWSAWRMASERGMGLQNSGKRDARCGMGGCGAASRIPHPASRYSYRSASTGSSRAARLAGYSPNPTPVRADAPSAATMDHSGTWAGIGVSRETPKASRPPTSIPAAPPTRVRVEASTRNCHRIARRVAPSALRTPISRVRSVTEIIMIATTPTPPTMRPMDESTSITRKISGMFFLVMLVLSSIGLIVGGVGVVAIMMISVTERTREIGVRKALGATRRAILWQFLVEASTLTLVGGAVGMLAGGLLAFGVSRLTPIPAHVPLWSIVAALGASALTGVGFGLYPASRAARLDPVEALRYE